MSYNQIVTIQYLFSQVVFIKQCRGTHKNWSRGLRGWAGALLSSLKSQQKCTKHHVFKKFCPTLIKIKVFAPSQIFQSCYNPRKWEQNPRKSSMLYKYYKVYKDDIEFRTKNWQKAYKTPRKTKKYFSKRICRKHRLILTSIEQMTTHE